MGGSERALVWIVPIICRRKGSVRQSAADHAPSRQTRRQSDSTIDFSDIPPLPDKFWQNAARNSAPSSGFCSMNPFYRPYSNSSPSGSTPTSSPGFAARCPTLAFGGWEQGLPDPRQRPPPRCHAPRPSPQSQLVRIVPALAPCLPCHSERSNPEASVTGAIAHGRTAAASASLDSVFKLTQPNLSRRICGNSPKTLCPLSPKEPLSPSGGIEKGEIQ